MLTKKPFLFLFYIELAILLLLIFLSIVMYNNYGHGMGYFTFIILPLISIGVGFLGLLMKKWWVIALIFLICETSYLYVKSSLNIGFVFFIVIYASLSILVGCTSQQVKQKNVQQDYILSTYKKAYESQIETSRERAYRSMMSPNSCFNSSKS